jgi:hypothetical protein
MPVKIPYPYSELRFDAKGTPEDAKQLPALIDGLKKSKITDLFIASHGWNNDQKEANALYTELFTNVKKQEGSVNTAGRAFAVAGIIWPSKKFDTAEDAPNAASLDGNAGHTRVKKQVDTLKAFFADGPGAAKHAKDLDRAKALIPKLEKDPKARAEFSKILIARLPKSVGEEGGWHINAEVAKPLMEDGTLLERLGGPPVKVANGAGGGGAAAMPMSSASAQTTFEGAAGLGDLLKGVISGAANLVNVVTYYQMKERAGTVGRAGVNAAIAKVRSALPNVRIHLVGHSFGCRLVTAAVTGSAAKPAGFANSMSLLQGAFSHYSFAAKYDNSNKQGFFRSLITEARVSGPVVITHTRADKAVGLAYAVASRVARQIAAAIGDKNDPYGGLGSNGAQKTTEARDSKMPKAGAPFDVPLKNGSVTNLLADGLITSHSDVRNANAAYVVLSAACATS